MSHPKLWLQFLPPLEPALSPQAGRFPFPNLSPSEGWVLMAAVARSRPQTRAGEPEAPVLARGASPILARPVSWVRSPPRPLCAGGGLCSWAGSLPEGRVLR